MSDKKKKFHATIRSVEDLSPGLRRLQLQSPELSDFHWSAGDKVKLRIRDKIKRSYTPASVDARSGTMDVVIRLHGKGPFARWVADCQPGDTIRVKGPKSSMKGPRGGEEWAVLFGDATTLGLARALDDALGEDTTLQGAVELPTADLAAPAKLGLSGIDAIPYREHFADALLAWLAAWQIPNGRGTIWISGHKPSAYAVRRKVEERGVPESAIRFKGYWD